LSNQVEDYYLIVSRLRPYKKVDLAIQAFNNLKLPLKIIGGGYNGEKIDLEKINFLATLPSMDELRGKILGIISAPAQKIALIMKEPAGQIARLVSAQSKSLEESN